MQMTAFLVRAGRLILAPTNLSTRSTNCTLQRGPFNRIVGFRETVIATSDVHSTRDESHPWLTALVASAIAVVGVTQVAETAPRRDWPRREGVAANVREYDKGPYITSNCTVEAIFGRLPAPVTTFRTESAAVTAQLVVGIVP